MDKTEKKSIVDKYIEGYDFPNIEMMENDMQFMLSVLKKTKDTKMMNFASEELLSNIDFIKECINIFSYTPKFVAKFIHDFLTNNIVKRNEEIELYILLSNLITSKHLDSSDINMITCFLKLQTFYIEEKVFIENYKNIKQVKSKINIQKGFRLLQVCYDNKTILDFLANKLLEEIFESINNMPLKYYLHSKEVDINDIHKYGINNFLLNIIKKEDLYLMNYVAVNINILSKYNKQVSELLENYDALDYSLREEKCRNALSYIDEVYESNKLQFNHFFDEIVVYIISKLNLKEEFDKYGDMAYEEEIKPCSIIVSDDSLSFSEKSILRKLLKDVEGIFSKVVYEEPENFYLENNVLSFVNDNSVKK